MKKIFIAVASLLVWVGAIAYLYQKNAPSDIPEAGVYISTDNTDSQALVGTTPSQLKPVSATCVADGRQDFECFEAYYMHLVESSGVELAFTELKKNYETSEAVRIECHQITHSIGHAAILRTGDVGKAFSIGDAMCWSGYYHGVMEEALEGLGTTSLESTINTICGDIPGKEAYSFDYYNCVHGLGHGVMLLYDFDLFKSLDVCSTLTGRWEQDSCGGGVFMENTMVEHRGGKSDYLKREDLLYPCNAVSDTHKTQCYMMQSSYMLSAVNSNFSTVFKICGTVEEPYRNICYQSLGRDASGHAVSNASRTAATCNLAPDSNALQNCVVGAVKDFISFYHSDVEAREFCAQFDDATRRICLDTTDAYYATF